ncbi:MAG: hypothetical protein ACRD1K_01115 [Acidimicrobiales bacterium]
MTMDPALILHTAARHYLIDRRVDWITACSRVLNDGHAGDGYHYRDDAKNIFPRYNVLQAIRVDVERLDPGNLPERDVVVAHLVHAGYHAEDLFTGGDPGEIEQRAMDEERLAFVDWVERTVSNPPASVRPLPFRRTLTTEEGVRWKAGLEERWNLEQGGWWKPIVERADSDQALALDATAFWDENDAGPATTAVREALRALGVERVIELREYGPEFEADLDLVEPTYNGAEGLFTSEGLAWLLFASHEGVSAIGGTIVEPFKQLWPDWREARWQGFNF